MENPQPATGCLICYSKSIDKQTKVSAEKSQQLLTNCLNQFSSVITQSCLSVPNEGVLPLCKQCYNSAKELKYVTDEVTKNQKELATLILGFSMSVVHRRSIHSENEASTEQKIELNVSGLPSKWFRNKNGSTQNKSTSNIEQQESVKSENIEVANPVTSISDTNVQSQPAEPAIDNQEIPFENSAGNLGEISSLGETCFDDDNYLCDISNVSREVEKLWGVFDDSYVSENTEEASNNLQQPHDCDLQSVLVTPEILNVRHNGESSAIPTESHVENANAATKTAHSDYVGPSCDEDEDLLIIPPDKIKTEILTAGGGSQASFTCTDVEMRSSVYNERGIENTPPDTVGVISNPKPKIRRKKTPASKTNLKTIDKDKRTRNEAGPLNARHYESQLNSEFCSQLINSQFSSQLNSQLNSQRKFNSQFSKYGGNNKK